MTEGPVKIGAILDGSGRLLADPRIINLLSNLPVLSDMRDRVEDAAEGLTNIIVFSSGRDLPKREAAGSRIAVKELVAAGRLAKRLKDRLDQLHKEPYEIINRQVAAKKLHLDMSSGVLQVRRESITNGMEALKSLLSDVHSAAQKGYFMLTANNVPARSGRRPRFEAQRITDAAADAYERLTGRPVARIVDRNSGEPCGPFHDLLTQVFSVARININVDEQVRSLLERRCNKKRRRNKKQR